MKLLSLILENFQGKTNAKFDFDGHSAAVYGDNETGKTTIYNAVTWLLWGKASTGAASFSPKTKDKHGEDVHYLDHSVEAVFVTELGARQTFKRLIRENYKKRRGSVTEEFDGHLIDYYVDGVPVKEREFKASTQSVFGTEEQMKALMMPDYFSESLSWEKRRQLLLDICGDVSDEEIIQSTSELFELRNRLLMPGSESQYYTVDMYRRIATSQMKEINQQLQTIPARVDEAQKAQPDLEDVDSEETLTAEISNLNKILEAKQKAITQLELGDKDLAGVRSKVAEVQAEMAESRAAFIEKSSKTNTAAYEKLHMLQSGGSMIKTELITNRLESDRIQKDHKRMVIMREALLTDYAKASAETWKENETCPTCGQNLPADVIEKAHSAFNLKRSNKLEELNRHGKEHCSKEMIAQLELDHAAVEEQISINQTNVGELENQIKTVKDSIVPPPPFEQTTGYMDFAFRIEQLEKKEEATESEAGKATIALVQQIDSLRLRIGEKQRELAQRSLAEQQSDRIEQLKAEEKQFAQEYENLQAGVNLCELFIKAKVNALTERINNRFTSVRFRLFQQQINGGVKEDCEVMVPSGDGRLVPYSFANNAGRINAGLEIINTLAEHWGFSMPVFVDNAESVTQLRPIKSQLIRLTVNAADKVLRIKQDDNTADEAAV